MSASAVIRQPTSPFPVRPVIRKPSLARTAYIGFSSCNVSQNRSPFCFLNPVLGNVVGRRAAGSNCGSFALRAFHARADSQCEAVRRAGIGRNTRLKQRRQQECALPRKFVHPASLSVDQPGVHTRRASTVTPLRVHNPNLQRQGSKVLIGP
jgi:hypothetical protein